MKKFTMLLTLAAFIIGGTIFYSCQKEETQQTPEKKVVNVLKDVPVPGEFPLCDEGCLDDGPFYLITTSWTAQWSELTGFSGYFKNNKKFVATSWNDDEFFYIQANVFGYQYETVNSNTGQGQPVWVLTEPTYVNYPFSTVIITLNGVEYTYAMDDPATPGIETAIEYIQTFPLPEGWEACTPMVYTVRLEGDGRPIWLGTYSTPAYYTYNLYDHCGCEESFCFVANDDGTYTFTYVPSVSMEDAYLEFTFPGTTVEDLAEGWSNPASGVPANVKQITIDLVECVPYVFTFKLTNENGPLWTDFKVNGVKRNLGYGNDELVCD